MQIGITQQLSYLEYDGVRVDVLEGDRLGHRAPHGHPERVHVALRASRSRAFEEFWCLQVGKSIGSKNPWKNFQQVFGLSLWQANMQPTFGE